MCSFDHYCHQRYVHYAWCLWSCYWVACGLEEERWDRKSNNCWFIMWAWIEKVKRTSLWLLFDLAIETTMGKSENKQGHVGPGKERLYSRVPRWKIGLPVPQDLMSHYMVKFGDADGAAFLVEQQYLLFACRLASSFLPWERQRQRQRDRESFGVCSDHNGDGAVYAILVHVLL